MTYLYEYQYQQNNSGGFFDSGDGLAMKVLIEAKNADQANEIAHDIGIYFDGVSNGSDCGCCGNFWYMSNIYETMEEVWNGVSDFSLRFIRNFKVNPLALAVHYLDGRVIEMDHDQYEKAYKAHKESKSKK